MKLPDDPLVLELLPEFIEDWLEQLDNEFNELFDKKDKDGLYRLSHTMKGSSYQFGFQDLGDKGVEMMEQVKEEKWDDLKANKEAAKKRFLEIKEYIENNPVS